MGKFRGKPQAKKTLTGKRRKKLTGKVKKATKLPDKDKPKYVDLSRNTSRASHGHGAELEKKLKLELAAATDKIGQANTQGCEN
eukprot:m.109724 g.109724  ORF g.109724 m.109724 type:complete len:84 (-) comp27978_c0_seq1:535-786(-)